MLASSHSMDALLEVSFMTKALVLALLCTSTSLHMRSRPCSALVVSGLPALHVQADTDLV